MVAAAFNADQAASAAVCPARSECDVNVNRVLANGTRESCSRSPFKEKDEFCSVALHEGALSSHLANRLRHSLRSVPNNGING
jgi:hypothetical protein